MLTKNILILTVFISFGIYDSAQAETIRGIEIPDLNISAALGKWYGLASGNNDDSMSCTTMTLGPLSERSFTMNSTFYESEKEPYSLVFNCTLAENSNIIVCDKGVAGEMIAVIFDIKYDSYMAMYTTSTIENAGSGDNGYVFILGRDKTLPEGVFEKVKQSSFFVEGTKPGVGLYIVRTDGCD